MAAKTDTQFSDTLPLRDRVAGRDRAKDAAQIERVAQTAGIAPEVVKVLAATHIKTLNVPKGHFPEIEKTVSTTGYGFDRNNGDDDAQLGAVHQDPFCRRALWIAILLNVGRGTVEMVGGFLAGS